MNYGNCKNCNAMIKYERIPLCSKCEKEFYLKVREFIYKNGSASPQEIHKETQVPLKVIDYFIENGSLYDENIKLDEEMELSEKINTINELRNLRKEYISSQKKKNLRKRNK